MATADDLSEEVAQRRARHESAHAVTAWALGADLGGLELSTLGSSRGRCWFQLDEKDPTEAAWIALVTALAGNQLDLPAGHSDEGSREDIKEAFVDAAVIISTGRAPTAHAGGELTTDALLASARTQADELLATHKDLVDVVATTLLAKPARRWVNPDLDALHRRTARTEGAK